MNDVFPFIVGVGRSGTTLLRAMLDSHPQLAIPPESRFVVDLVRQRKRYEEPGGFDVDAFSADLTSRLVFKLWQFSEAEVRAMLKERSVRGYADAIRALYELYAARLDKSLYGDKTPRNLLYMRELADLFPESRFVHLIRDGRDVALSYLDVGFGPVFLEEAALRWKRHLTKGRKVGRELGDERYLELRYEELVRQPETTLSEICDFLGMSFDAAMLDYTSGSQRLIDETLFGYAHSNLKRKPTPQIRDWRHQLNAKEAGVFEVIAGDLLEELGYETGEAPRTAAVRATALGGRVRRQLRRVTYRARRWVRSSK